MRRMRAIRWVLLCGWLLAGCANSTPPIVPQLEPTLPPRPDGLLSLPARPLPPADDPPSQEAMAAYAVELLGHVLALEAQLRALEDWFGTALPPPPRPGDGRRPDGAAAGTPQTIGPLW